MDVTIPCVCGSHDEDTVHLRERLGFVEASAIRNGIALRRADSDEDLETGEILAILTEGYILYGVESWSLKESGKALPVTRANIRRLILANWEAASIVADAADEAYASAVMLPLLARASTSSRPTPTNASTSPNPPSPTPRPKPSRRSSISTIPTDDTATITSRPGGGSRSSQSSTSAA
jgi:hypothetical protein